MALFSERYGYTKPSDIIIREQITPEMQNTICNCYLKLNYSDENLYFSMDRDVWTDFLHQKIDGYPCTTDGVIINYIEGANKWYEKFNLIEYSIKYIFDYYRTNTSYGFEYTFIKMLNYYFEQLNFAYRIVNNEIVEITAKEEIMAIEDALKNSKSNIRNHLNKALELYAQKPIGDYQNSIKESISAVEAFCREKTEQDTLGKALNKLESNGILIPKLLKQAFEKLYAYTNQPETGIRHALMDNEGTYIPAQEEALFMLVSCSVFINYLNKKMK